MSPDPSARVPHLPVVELLRDDTTATIRHAVAADGPAVARMHRRCSLETVFRRYLTAVPQVSPMLQQRLLALHLTVVAEVGGEIVGMGHLATAEAQPTELAVIVEDAWQRRGLGQALAETALRAADAEGLREVVAYTLPSSVAVHTLLRRLRGGDLTPTFRHGTDGLVTVTLHLSGTRHLAATPAPGDRGTDQSPAVARRLSA